ncbi:MAG: hypothetical protein V4495_02945 [Pseudomonadota bacterium]
MVHTINNRQPRAWPKMQKSIAQEPEFDAQRSSQHIVDMEGLLHAVPSRIRQEYTSALAMCCAGQPEYAEGYLLRAEYVYQTYGTLENYRRVPEHRPHAVLYNRGTAKTRYALVRLALLGDWDIGLLQDGLEDLHGYLMEQSYDETCAYAQEDEERLFTVLCQIILGNFEKASAWFDAYIKHRKAKKFKENFAELLAGIQTQLRQGQNVIAEPLQLYFDQNRLGGYKFSESQSFGTCVPIAILMERVKKGWKDAPVWGDVLEYLLY